MLNRSMAATVSVLVMLFARPVAADDLKTAIIGNWKMTSFVRKELGTGQESHFYGERPTGYSVYTAGGAFFTYVVGEGRKRPAGASATDAERAALYNSMYAYSGTYRVEGDQLIYQLDGSWNEVWTGTQRTVRAKIGGGQLTITSLPFKGGVTGVEVVVTNTFDRVK